MKRKIIDWIGTFITFASVLFCVYCIWGVVREYRTGDMFYVLGFRPVIILSGSMEPCLETGAVVIVQKTKEIEEQDAVFFVTDKNVPVIHRYVGKDQEGKIITKGDANVKEDFEHISMAQIKEK